MPGALRRALVRPLIPPAKRGGDKRTADVREVVNGLFYVLSTGCQWRAMPKDLPPRSTVHGYFDLWTWDGTLDCIHFTLYQQCREQAGREVQPSAAIIDSQSVKSAEKGGSMTAREEPVLGPARGWTRGMRAKRSRARSGTFSSTRKAS